MSQLPARFGVALTLALLVSLAMACSRSGMMSPGRSETAGAGSPVSGSSAAGPGAATTGAAATGAVPFAAFPPRNEPFAFRQDLEAKYRDGLRRSPTSTFVDLEGDIVWIQEYLRYRVGGCSHADAESRVFAQISGGGVQPVCSSTESPFPPRNEPFAFRQDLETRYRDVLRRSATSSFVDIEGDIVWIQEYLRYRVSSCGHQDAETKVFIQIDGRGVQADCKPTVTTTTTTTTTSTIPGTTTSFAGTWRGSIRSTSCSASGVFASLCISNPLLSDTLTLVLNQSGTSVSGTIDVGGVTAPASGSAQGNRLVISGSTVSSGVTVTYDSWDTSVSGTSMTGGFAVTFSASGASGTWRYAVSLVGVTRTSSSAFLMSDVQGSSSDGLAALARRAAAVLRIR